MNEDVATIWSAQQEMYAGFETGNRARTDQHIHESCTIWDSGHWENVTGVVGLNAVRAARPTGPDQPVVASLTAYDPQIDVVGDIAVARHLARVVYEGETPDKHVRNTGIWRRFRDGWKLVHNHEETAPEATDCTPEESRK